MKAKHDSLVKVDCRGRPRAHMVGYFGPAAATRVFGQAVAAGWVKVGFRGE